jgi:hypothetical protein
MDVARNPAGEPVLQMDHVQSRRGPSRGGHNCALSHKGKGHKTRAPKFVAYYCGRELLMYSSVGGGPHTLRTFLPRQTLGRCGVS